MRWSGRSEREVLSTTTWLCSLWLLLLPTTLLSLLAFRLQSEPVAAGAGVQALFLVMFFRAHPVWRPPVGPSIVVLYLIALTWAWLPTRGTIDWAIDLVQGLLLIASVGMMALHDLTRTGAEPLRRANKWCKRITGRTEWPLQLSECRTLPEVAGLREAVRDDAGPALALLVDPRTEVQTAALGALEYRQLWQPGEAELVLRTAQSSREPGVRTAAAYALAGVEEASLVAGLGMLLRDPAPEVRRAAAESILWDGDRRWGMARAAVRDALADPKLAREGAIFPGTARLPAAAICDLEIWTTEPPPLSARAIVTLIEQYHSSLIDGDRPELGSELATQMLAVDTPPGLRVELAALLRDHQLLTPDLLDRMTNPDQPGPMRLFAAEVLLRTNPTDSDGIDVLRGLARQPNRDMAVAVAGILQNVLGLELGLPGGQVPASNSKSAADVTRRVLAWANGATPDMLRPTPPRGSAGIKPSSNPQYPGLPADPGEPHPRPRRTNIF